MLLLVLIFVLAAFCLLLIALVTGMAAWAWISVVVSVAAAGVLVYDWARRRSVAKGGGEQHSGVASGGDMVDPPTTMIPALGSTIDPVTEVFPAVGASRAGADPLVSAPSGSYQQPSSAEQNIPHSGADQSPSVTVGAPGHPNELDSPFAARPGDGVGDPERVNAAGSDEVAASAQGGPGSEGDGPVDSEAADAGGADRSERPVRDKSSTWKSRGQGAAAIAAGAAFGVGAAKAASGSGSDSSDQDAAGSGSKAAASAGQGAESVWSPSRATADKVTDGGSAADTAASDKDDAENAAADKAGDARTGTGNAGAGKLALFESAAEKSGADQAESGPGAANRSKPDLEPDRSDPDGSDANRAVPSASSGQATPAGSGAATAAGVAGAVAAGAGALAVGKGADKAKGPDSEATTAIRPSRPADSERTTAIRPGTPADSEATTAIRPDTSADSERTTAIRPDTSSAAADSEHITAIPVLPVAKTAGSGTGPAEAGKAVDAAAATQAITPVRGPAPDPAEEQPDRAAAAIVATLSDEVLVIDELPRFHLAGCRVLVGRETIPLPAKEAVEYEFTPCAVCTPVRVLAVRNRAASSS